MKEEEILDHEQLIKDALASGERYTDNAVPVGAAFARALLDLRDPERQRPIGISTVNDYADKMRRGEWRLTTDPIAVNTDGHLDNGQHRLEAVELTGLPQVFDILWNAEPGEFVAMDQQRRRSPADLLAIAGHRGRPSALAAAARMLFLFENARNESMTWRRKKVSPQQLLATLEQHPGLADELPVGEAIKKGCRLNPTAVAVGHYVCHKAFPAGANLLEQFVDGLELGENLSHGDPAYALREWAKDAPFQRQRAMKERAQAPLHLHLFIRCWNSTVKGESLHRISWKKEFSIPLPYSDGGSGRQP
jgi:hypothetical protein